MYRTNLFFFKLLNLECGAHQLKSLDFNLAIKKSIYKIKKIRINLQMQVYISITKNYNILIFMSGMSGMREIHYSN
jgi:hypothetical protein